MGHKLPAFWLDDDAEWEELQARINNQPIQEPPKPVMDTRKTPLFSDQPSSPKKIQLSINLSLPKIHIPRPSAKQLKITSATIGCLIIIITLFKIIPSKFGKKDPGTATITNSGVLADTTQKPNFDTISPNNSDVSSFGGFVKISPPNNEPVYAFIDSIDGVKIRVSQQQLPKSFQENPDEEVKKLAETYSANQVINESNPKAYVGNDVSGAQSVIFHKKGLLVFIDSKQTIDKSRWAEYITRLQ